VYKRQVYTYISKEFCNQLGFKKGVEVEMYIQDNELRIRKREVNESG
jgi:hypothetical protein